MGDVVNLNRFRKQKNKAESVKQADANRQSFGRSKTEKKRDSQDKARTEKDLDGKKLT